MKNEEDIAAMTLWVEQHCGPEAPRYVAEQISRSAKRGDKDSVDLWQSIGICLDGLVQNGSFPSSSN